MVELIGGAGFDDAEIVGDRTKRCERGAEGGSGFTILFEFKLWTEDGGISLNEGVTLVANDRFWEGRTFQF